MKPISLHVAKEEIDLLDRHIGLLIGVGKLAPGTSRKQVLTDIMSAAISAWINKNSP